MHSFSFYLVLRKANNFILDSFSSNCVCRV